MTASNFPMIEKYIYNDNKQSLNSFMETLNDNENINLDNELFFLKHTKKLQIDELMDEDYDNINDILIEYLEKCKNYKKSYIKNKKNIYLYRKKNRNKYNELNKKYSTNYSKKKVECPRCGKLLTQGYLNCHLKRGICNNKTLHSL